MPSLPTSGNKFMVVAPTASGSTDYFEWLVTDAGVVQMLLYQSSTLRSTTNGPTLSTNTWYRLDWDINTGGGQYAVNWQIDGSAQTQATYTATTSTIATVYVGVYNNWTQTMYFSDVALSTTAADYPIGAHRVEALLPNADGTHSLGGNIVNEGGGTTNLYQSVDEAWPVDDTTYINQATASASSYAEVAITDTAVSTTIWAVRFDVGVLAASTATCDLEIRALSGATSTTVSDGTIGATTARYHWEMVTAPGGTWDTTTEVNDLIARVGFSGDATPDAYNSGILVQVLYKE
jgi:hypothetical protein